MIPPRPREFGRGGMPGGWWSQRSTPFARRLRALVLTRMHPVAPYLRALRCGRDLVRTTGDATDWPSRATVACVTYRGERTLLDAFLTHHRALGIERFAFLDLSPDGALRSALAACPDCVVWQPRPGRRGREQSWANLLRFRHAVGRWCLSVGTTDFLVFSRCETRSLKSLTDFLETEHRDHAWGLTVDMYGQDATQALATGSLPSTALPYFDPIGYQTAEPADDGTTQVNGGVLRRTLFRTVPRNAPRLDCIPLVRWRRHFSYVDATRSLQPARLNRAHAPWHASPTVCLLRFSLPTEPPDETQPDRPALPARDLRTPASRRYRSSDDLVDCGMLNPGQWF